jgi:hypothetical protein
MQRRQYPIVWVLFAIWLLAVLPAEAQTLEGFAALPADTFAPGPTSGQFIAPSNGRTPPFADRQPVQGFSSVLRESNGEFLAMSDNGFGQQGNSADYVLRVYRIAPDFKTRNRGTGAVTIRSFISLRDPDHRLSFPIVASLTNYPASGIPVHPSIKQNRFLTGGDLDIESIRAAHDGTFWIGDEFGPFLIHTDATGKVLEDVFPLPGVRAPQNPFLGGGTPNLPSSKGFEGMAIVPNGKKLYPMLEGALTTDPDQRRLLINEFDLEAKQYTARQWWYRMDAPAHAIGDFTAVTDRRFLVIERDNNQGAAALFKKVFLVDLDVIDPAGYLVKYEVADLMALDDPNDLDGDGSNVFRFPFVTIESVIPLSEVQLGVLNDNNYPFSSGRTPGEPDSNEFILIRLPQPLAQIGKK